MRNDRGAAPQRRRRPERQGVRSLARPLCPSTLVFPVLALDLH